MATLTFSKEEYDRINDSLKRVGLVNRSRALRNGMSAAGDIVKRRAHDKIDPAPDYPGDIIGDLPLRDALKRRTMQWESGPVAMTTIVTYNYLTTAKHGHLVEKGHVITPTKGIRRTHIKRRIPGRASHWRTGLPVGARTIAKHYIDNAAEETLGQQKKRIEDSIKAVLKKEGN